MLLQELPNESYHFLVVGDVALPHSVAAHYYEQVAFVTVGLCYLRNTGHALVLESMLFVALVLEISERTGKA